MLTFGRTRQILLTLSTAALLIASLPPYDLWWLAWFALVPLLYALAQVRSRDAFLLGWLAGTAVNYGGFYWCLEMMHEFSNLGQGAYFVMLAMAIYQGLPWGIWGWLLRRPAGASPSLGLGRLALLASAGLFAVLEFFYPIIFPWYLANSQHTRVEVLSVVELGGVSLLTVLLVGCNLVLARLLIGRVDADQAGSQALWPRPDSTMNRFVVAAVMAVLLICSLAWHAYRAPRIEALMQESRALEVGVVQPNHWIGQSRAIDDLFDYQSMTWEMVAEAEAEGKPLDLILWPESAVRTPPTDHQRHLPDRGGIVLEQAGQQPRLSLDTVRVEPAEAPPDTYPGDPRTSVGDLLAVQRGFSVPLLFGTTLVDQSPEAVAPLPNGLPLYNSGVLLDAGGQVLGIAPKVKLLIFGETIPLSNRFPQVYRLLPLASALLPGEQPSVLDLHGARLGIMICYEDLLPWFHYELAQKEPQILLNLTNDAWFGKSAEAAAHLALAKMRAVEGRTYLIRSTTSGISVVVDPLGRVIGEIPLDERGTMRRTVHLMDVKTGFERFGDSVAWFFLLTLLPFLAFWFRRPSA